MSDLQVNQKMLCCKHFVVRKKRYCKMTVKKGEEYCGEHQKISEDLNPKTEEDNLRIRIVCPLDRKHTCYAHNLRKHLKICNARETQSEPYILKGINSGIEYDMNNEAEDSFQLLSTFPVSVIKNTIEKVNNIYEKYVNGNITSKILSHKLVEEEILKPEYGDRTKKHLKQASSILGLLNEYKLIKNNTCFIEFGAGRGQLSFWIALSTENDQSKILLIEKASPKHKRDNKLDKTTDKVQRVRADISDLVLDKLDIISKSENVVGVTKHLCGGATDLAIRCLTNVSENKDKILGAVLTFCCHHRCTWVPYTGKKFFEDNKLSRQDFYIMCGIASWATCGSGLSRDKSKNSEENFKLSERDQEIGLNREEKEEIGRRSKNIFNWGRLAYLEHLGFNCVLHYYVERCISLENVCIVFTKK